MREPVEIREEHAAERRETEHVVREAFWNVYSPACSERWLVRRLRRCAAFVPQLNLVAVASGRVLGHALCVRAHVDCDDGVWREALSLGPLSVLPGWQRRGIGGRLIEATRRRAAALGHRAILLFGDPAHYLRQGFEPAERHGIRTEDGCFAEALHVCPLQPRALEGLAGRYRELPDYAIDAEAVARFDAAFPPKTPRADTPSQRRFLEVASRRRPAHTPPC